MMSGERGPAVEHNDASLPHEKNNTKEEEKRELSLIQTNLQALEWMSQGAFRRAQQSLQYCVHRLQEESWENALTNRSLVEECFYTEIDTDAVAISLPLPLQEQERSAQIPVFSKAIAIRRRRQANSAPSVASSSSFDTTTTRYYYLGKKNTHKDHSSRSVACVSPGPAETSSSLAPDHHHDSSRHRSSAEMRMESTQSPLLYPRIADNTLLFFFILQYNLGLCFHLQGLIEFEQQQQQRQWQQEYHYYYPNLSTTTITSTIRSSSLQQGMIMYDVALEVLDEVGLKGHDPRLEALFDLAIHNNCASIYHRLSNFSDALCCLARLRFSLASAPFLGVDADATDFFDRTVTSGTTSLLVDEQHPHHPGAGGGGVAEAAAAAGKIDSAQF